MGMINAGMALAVVARHFNVCKRSIQRLNQRFNATGTVQDRPRSGRPRATTQRLDRAIVNTHVRNPFQSSAETARHFRLSKHTILRRLRDGGLRAYRPLRGAILTPLHRRNRQIWTQEHVRWSQRRWNRILFSDESRFLIRRIDGRERVFRRRGQRFHQAHIRQVDRFGGGSVMVWGGISAHHRTPLVTIQGNLTGQRYCDEILRPHVQPYMEQHGGMFQHDNARPHAAIVCQNFFQAHQIDVLDWPSRSPDLNPIEHLWDEIDQRIRNRPHPVQTRQELEAALHEEWQRIPQATIRTLVQSMNRRCVAVNQARGGHTQY